MSSTTLSIWILIMVACDAASTTANANDYGESRNKVFQNRAHGIYPSNQNITFSLTPSMLNNKSISISTIAITTDQNLSYGNATRLYEVVTAKNPSWIEYFKTVQLTVTAVGFVTNALSINVLGKSKIDRKSVV